MHISQQYFKSGDATIARRSRPPRRHDWSNTPDRAASLTRAHPSEQPQRRCSTPYYSSIPSIVCGKEETAWGDQVARSDGGSGGAARKKQSTHRKERHFGSDLLVSRRECAKEQDNEPYIVSRALLTMARHWRDEMI